MARLSKKISYTGTITLKTGLHIGGTNTAMNIGGPDKFVVRNPLTNIPYIPGSSLKGKMRSLIEMKEGTLNTDEKHEGECTTDEKTLAGALFGTAPIRGDSHPSRLIVRDAELNLEKSPDFSSTDMPYTESKTEVSINRINAKSNPRTIERVPAGAVFNVNMVINVFDSDDEKSLKETLLNAIHLLENDYLGGNGSRGYGQVEFSLTENEVKIMDLKKVESCN